MIGTFNYGWKVVGAMVAAGGLWAWGFHHGQGSERQTWELRWAVRDAGDLQARTLAEQQARENELAEQSAMDQVQENAAKQIEAAQADASVAGVAADRLREQVTRLLASSQTSCKTEAGASRPAAENPGNLLAVVLDKSIERNRELAAFADSALIAARNCRAAYGGR